MAFIVPLFALAVIGFIAFLAVLLVIKNVLYVGGPNEVMIFSGFARTAADGRPIGYRFIKGGRTFRVPLLETVDRMDLTNMVIELTVKNAYSRGGIPLTVHGVANIKVPGEEPLIHNALERFLGKSRTEIMEIAQETLEGNLRGVLATLTPEQVNQDKEAFALRLTEEGEHDLSLLGLVLDTLKIQNVTDEVGYLDATGRKRSAEVRRNAQIAEARAKAEAAEQKWRNTMEAEVSKLEAHIQVAAKENERRIVDARTKREAMIAEQQAEVQALIAQAAAEVQMQDARIDQVKLQLQADVIQPAEAARSEAEQNAKADASKLIEQGKATATVLKNLAATYRGSGTNGRDVLLMQKLVPMLSQITGTIGNLRINRLTVIGTDANANGNGNGNGKYDSSLASKLVQTSEQIKAAVGLDVPEMIRERFGGGTPSMPKPPTVPPPPGGRTLPPAPRRPEQG
ncbi:MAG: SPFH domain-containing protein [Myxococcota bacterium]|nr:SPFH domain-containing protein [Myxococcota bacterium]